MKITNLGNGKIAVDSPYNPEFVKKIKVAGGRWNSLSKTWELDERSIEAVRSIMREVYGQDDMPQELVDVRVFVRDKHSLVAEKGPFMMFGRIVASAWGRDTGAKIGEGVCFEKGECKSGGSMKHWDTRIETGSVIVIYDVPKNAVEERIGWDDDWGTFEIIEPLDPYASLRAEKEALLKRLAEIEEILKETE